MGQIKLTFGKRRFHLLGFRETIPPGWDKLGPFHLTSNSLKAAVSFRPYADEKAKRVLERSLNRHYETPRLPQLSFLDSHQLEGIKWILSRKRCYLAHAPGAGKTATTLTAAWINEKSTNVIIVPPGLTWNWAKEIEKFASQFSFLRPTISIVDSKANREFGAVDWSANFLLVPDSMLAKPWVYEGLQKIDIHLLGVDEASRFKEITSQRSVALFGGRVGDKIFQGLSKKARHVVLLDGSPMPNGRPMELWAPIYALDPGIIEYRNRHEFGLTYCNAFEDRWGRWNYNGSSRPAELKYRLRMSFMHVVNEEALKHPERRRSLLFIDHDVRSVKHKSWERAHLDELDLKDLNENANQGDLARWRCELGLRKVPWAADYIIDRSKSKGESMLVFCWHRDVANELCDKLCKGKLSAAVIQGGTPPKVREKHFQQFQAGKLKIIVGNIQAMGRGHNLQKADRVIFVESSWSDELNRQCEKRASRRGRKQSKFVRCEYIVAPDSMDERVMSSVFTKQRRVKSVLG